MYKRKKHLLWQCNELLTICIFQELKLWCFWFATKLMRGWNWWQVQWANLSVCAVAEAYWGQLTHGRCDSYWLHMYCKDDLVSKTGCRQAIRGAQGHPWSGVGREGLMRNRPSLSLPLSPLKPSKHCPAACCTAMWTQLSVSQNSLAYHTKSLFSETDKNQEEQRKRNIPGSGISPRNS